MANSAGAIWNWSFKHFGHGHPHGHVALRVQQSKSRDLCRTVFLPAGHTTNEWHEQKHNNTLNCVFWAVNRIWTLTKFTFNICILWVENGSTRHLLFKMNLNHARLMLTWREPFGTSTSFEWSKFSVPSCTPSQPLSNLLTFFQNDVVGGVRLRAKGELTLKLHNRGVVTLLLLWKLATGNDAFNQLDQRIHTMQSLYAEINMWYILVTLNHSRF